MHVSSNVNVGQKLFKKNQKYVTSPRVSGTITCIHLRIDMVSISTAAKAAHSSALITGMLISDHPQWHKL